MMMQMLMRHELSLSGGCTTSIFPKVENWLDADCDHYNALKFVAARKDMDRYWSVIDFIFIELHPKWRKQCFAFYDDKAPPLHEAIDERQRKHFEARMLVLLEMAYAAFCQDRWLSWGHAVALVELVDAA